MKILLVWPYGYSPSYVLPLSLGYLKSNISENHDVMILDCSLEGLKSSSTEFRKRVSDFGPDIVGVSAWSVNFMEALDTLRKVKEIDSEIITVIGGAHVTSSPETALEEPCIDYIFRGESELSFSEFIEESGKGKPSYRKIKGIAFRNPDGTNFINETDRIDELDSLRLPDYDFIGLKKYIRYGYRYFSKRSMNAPVWLTRGCPYKCRFCTSYILNGHRIRKHSMDFALSWIIHLYNDYDIRHISIIDDNFLFDKEYAKEFCRNVIELGLKDLTFSTPNGVRMNNLDRETLNLLKKAGWSYLNVAPESGSKHVLSLMQKFIDPEMVLKKIKDIKASGLRVHGCFIIGYPGETKADISMTRKMIRSCDLDFFTINYFQPLPGSSIYKELQSKGKIEKGFIPSNFSEGMPVYVPDNLDRNMLSRVRLQEYLRFYIHSPLKLLYILRILMKRFVLMKIIRNVLKK